MARPVAISTVAATLDDIFTGTPQNRRLDVPAFTLSTSLLSRVPSKYRFTRPQKLRYLKILGNIALDNLATRRTRSGARQSAALSNALLQFVRSLPDADSEDQLNDSETLVHARILALGAYTLCADELLFQRNRETELAYQSRVTTKLRAAERKYQALLESTHDAAKSGDRTALRGTIEDLLTFTRGQLFSITQRIGLSTTKDTVDKPIMRAEVRIAALIRRTAMLVAACVMLDQRLAIPRTNRTTRKLALRRTTLFRDLPDWSGATTVDASTQNGQVEEILTRIENIQFIRRGNKPLSTADCINLTPGLQVAYKALWQSGISAGPIWFRGKYKTADNAFEMEFEGVGQHASTVWEDWLANEARHAFDINIGNLHAEAALPLLRTGASGLELVNRVGRI